MTCRLKKPLSKPECFNEAAAITLRKHKMQTEITPDGDVGSFNEAAAITLRKRLSI